MSAATRRYSNRTLAFATFVLMAAVMLLMLAAAEMLARLLEPRPPASPPFYRSDPVLGWVPQPGNYTIATTEFSFSGTINSLTMNDREVVAGDLTRPRRILALGDSHTFAVGAPAEATWPKRLEARLFPDEPRGGVVWNAGVPGYSLGQYLLRFRSLQPQLHANLVVVGFSMATDLYDLIPPERGGFVYGGNAARTYFDLGANGELTKKTYRAPKRDEAAPEATRDRALGLRDYLGHLALYRRFKRSNLAVWIAVHSGFGGHSLWPGLDTALKKELTEDDRYRWLLAERILAELVEEARASGAQTVIVNMPYLAQVYDDVWAWSFGTKPDTYDRWIAGRRLGEICSRIGAGYIDTTDDFIAAVRARGHWLHWPQDAHPTPEGHDLIAAVAARGLPKAATVAAPAAGN